MVILCSDTGYSICNVEYLFLLIYAFICYFENQCECERAGKQSSGL